MVFCFTRNRQIRHPNRPVPPLCINESDVSKCNLILENILLLHHRHSLRHHRPCTSQKQLSSPPTLRKPPLFRSPYEMKALETAILPHLKPPLPFRTSLESQIHPLLLKQRRPQ